MSEDTEVVASCCGDEGQNPEILKRRSMGKEELEELLGSETPIVVDAYDKIQPTSGDSKCCKSFFQNLPVQSNYPETKPDPVFDFKAPLFGYGTLDDTKSLLAPLKDLKLDAESKPAAAEAPEELSVTETDSGDSTTPPSSSELCAGSVIPKTTPPSTGELCGGSNNPKIVPPSTSELLNSCNIQQLIDEILSDNERVIEALNSVNSPLPTPPDLNPEVPPSFRPLSFIQEGLRNIDVCLCFVSSYLFYIGKSSEEFVVQLFLQIQLTFYKAFSKMATAVTSPIRYLTSTSMAALKEISEHARAIEQLLKEVNRGAELLEKASRNLLTATRELGEHVRTASTLVTAVLLVIQGHQLVRTR